MAETGTENLIAKQTFDIVTVVFSAEIPLLRLQARSLARFMPCDLVGRIILIVNDVDEDVCKARAQEILPDYGPLQGKVTIVRPDEIIRPQQSTFRRLKQWYWTRTNTSGKHVGWKGHTGWAAQQAFKLLVARMTVAPYVVLLDAKNHFIGQLEWQDFIAKDGRANARPIALNDLHFSWLQSSLKALRLHRKPSVYSTVPAGITPIVFPGQAFRKAVDLIEARVGAIEAFFVSRQSKATEFMMVYAVFEELLGGWDAHFAKGLEEPLTVFASHDARRIDSVLSAANERQAKFFGIHRKQFGKLSTEQQKQLSALWTRFGIVEDEAMAQEIISDMRGKFDTR